MSAGTAYLVGEKGPELFVPRAAGTIIPNGATGGLTVNFAPVIQSTDEGVVEVVRTELSGMLPDVTDAIRAAVATDLYRPSPLRR